MEAKTQIYRELRKGKMNNFWLVIKRSSTTKSSDEEGKMFCFCVQCVQNSIWEDQNYYSVEFGCGRVHPAFLQGPLGFNHPLYMCFVALENDSNCIPLGSLLGKNCGNSKL